MLSHEARLRKFKTIEITPCMLSDQQGIKLEIKNLRHSRKYTNTCRLNKNLLNEHWVKEVIKRKLKDCWKYTKNVANQIQQHTKKFIHPDP